MKENHFIRKKDERPKKMDIVPDGDVVLKVGRDTDTIDIKVSGAVIRLASPVFSAMLSSPMWREYSSKQIELYDENCDIVLAFCNLLHFKWEDIKLETSEELVKFAVFADMRCCTSVVKP